MALRKQVLQAGAAQYVFDEAGGRDKYWGVAFFVDGSVPATVVFDDDIINAISVVGNCRIIGPKHGWRSVKVTVPSVNVVALQVGVMYLATTPDEIAELPQFDSSAKAGVSLGCLGTAIQAKADASGKLAADKTRRRFTVQNLGPSAIWMGANPINYATNGLSLPPGAVATFETQAQVYFMPSGADQVSPADTRIFVEY